jgi:hypothetical protein
MIPDRGDKAVGVAVFGGAMTSGDFDHEGALAEFAALRQEVERRRSLQHQLFALQLTFSAAVFSFALSDRTRVPLLLILPIATYMLCGRFVSQHYGIVYAGQYIREVLDSKVPGGLSWEQWVIDHRRRQLFFLESIDPHYVTFPGIAYLALAWTAPYVFSFRQVNTVLDIIMLTMWVIGFIAAAASLYMTWFARRGWWRLHGRWLPTGRSEISGPGT